MLGLEPYNSRAIELRAGVRLSGRPDHFFVIFITQHDIRNSPSFDSITCLIGHSKPQIQNMTVLDPFVWKSSKNLQNSALTPSDVLRLVTH